MDDKYSLYILTKDLQPAVNLLQKLLTKIKSKPRYPILDVVIKLNSVELRILGISQIINADHKNVFSFTIPFREFYLSALGTTANVFSAEISSGSIKIGNRVFTSEFIKLFHPENIQTFDITMNSNAIDILTLRNRCSEQELIEKNYLSLVEEEELKMESEIQKGLKYLSKYGVTYSMLKRIINKNIRDKS